jgi:hypothetical protein
MTVDLSPSRPDGILEQAVVLGPEQPPGPWDVYLVLHQRPMTRAEVRAAVEQQREDGALPLVLRSPLLVEGSLSALEPRKWRDDQEGP